MIQIINVMMPIGQSQSQAQVPLTFHGPSMYPNQSNAVQFFQQPIKFLCLKIK